MAKRGRDTEVIGSTMYPLDIPFTPDDWEFLLGLITRKKEHEQHLVGYLLHCAGASCAGWFNATIEPRFPESRAVFILIDILLLTIL